MFDLGTDWWEIVLRTTIVYVALVAGFRLTGKRQIGQMAPFDLVVILLIANAVQNAMVGPDTSLLGGLISAAALLSVNHGVAFVREHIPFFSNLVEGKPVLLVSDGKILHDHLRKEGIEIDELLQAVREHGIANLSEVLMAVLEVDGTISIIPLTQQPLRSQKRFRQRHRQN